jgi:hypothetical protein
MGAVGRVDRSVVKTWFADVNTLTMVAPSPVSAEDDAGWTTGMRIAFDNPDYSRQGPPALPERAAGE